MSYNVYIAVDLGAGSGRVFVCEFGGRLAIDEVHRFVYPPREIDEHLRWDFELIFREIVVGLRSAADFAAERGKKIVSLGVDSWAVDYGLVGPDGTLLADPVCYRDARNEGMMARVFGRCISPDELFRRTGIQFLPFNTIFQLMAETELENAETLLMLPDLINYRLSGGKFCEFTNATTMQLGVDRRTLRFDEELLAKLGLRPEFFAQVVKPGTCIGGLLPGIEAETGLKGTAVIAPATHDTGSAVAGAPLLANQAYISSGTWSLVGVELSEPLINDEVAAHNFTNEGGVYGTTRFLKNVMGLWIFESCRREWAAGGFTVGYDAILDDVAKNKDFAGFIFPDDDRFLNPPSMIAAIASQLRESGQDLPDDPVLIAKIVLDSLAFRYASVLRTIENLTGRTLAGIQIVGGGGRNRYLNQMTANAAGIPVEFGLAEATVTGNALVQAITAGEFPDLKTARIFVRDSLRFERFEPIVSSEIADAAARYHEIEQRFLK